jgi:hypothetical protein
MYNNCVRPSPNTHLTSYSPETGLALHCQDEQPDPLTISTALSEYEKRQLQLRGEVTSTDQLKV